MLRFLACLLVTLIFVGCATVKDGTANPVSSNWESITLPDGTILSIDMKSIDVTQQQGKQYVELTFRISGDQISRIKVPTVRPIVAYENTVVVSCSDGEILLTRIKALASKDEVLFDHRAATLSSPPHDPESAYGVLGFISCGSTGMIQDSSPHNKNTI